MAGIAGYFLRRSGYSIAGIILGVILSQIAIAVRIIFGIERTYMGGGD